MSRVLVTGVSGFVGEHLVRALVRAGHEVIGTGLSPAVQKDGLARYYKCDLTDPADVAGLPLEKIDAVINLAGLASIGKSFDQPDEYMRVNTAVLSVLGDEIIKQSLQSQIRIIAVSSGAVYANDQPMPLTEESKVSADSSPYAVSKLAMERLADGYNAAGLRCIVARPFNHIGPGQGEGFLLPDLYAKLTEALKSDQPMRVGNLTTKRDYTDVRDVVDAYVALATSPDLSSALYNVCSGTARSGEEVLQALVSVVGEPKEIIVDDNLFRPSDAPNLYGSNQRITADTNWQPSIAFDQTIADYVNSRQS